LLSIEKNIPAENLKKIEVIVVDQSSVRFLAEYNFSFKLKIIGSQRGASVSRNNGFKISSGQFVWFLDDDAIVNNLDFKYLFSASQEIYFIEWAEKPSALLPFGFNYKINLVRKSGTPFYILPKKIFFDVGGFDEELGPGTVLNGGEDLDLLLRINRFRRIKKINLIGAISHEVMELNNIKVAQYAYARGIVLKKNKEKFLIFMEIIFSLNIALKGNITRIKYVLLGLVS
jgi:glycosyltransferase involved in cell wall biosynthesis